MTYCQYIETLPPGEKRDLHKNYHDNHYGFPLHDDNELFGRLVLKINAAIRNAKVILALQKEYDSFEKWLELNHPKTLAE
jgi:DNA-3-methyladenine glycosylase I